MTSASDSSSEPPERPSEGLLASPDHLDHALGRFLSEARVDEAAAGRRRRQAMRTAASQDATLLGMFVEIAELGLTATVSMPNGSRVVGGVVAVGRDFITLHADGARVLVPERAIVGFELPAGTLVSGIDRMPTTTTRFGDLFSTLAEELAVLRVIVGPETVQGVLTAAGSDVLTIETPSPRWLRIDAIDAVRLA